MMRKQRGVTLIEIMISMMLGLGLIAGIGQLFIQSQKSFTLQRNLSDMTDDAAFLLESLAKGVLLAGYSETGKMDQFVASSNVLSSGIDFNQNEYLHGSTTDSTDSIDSIDSMIYRFKLADTVGCTENYPRKDDITCELDNFVGTGGLTGNDIVDDTVSPNKKRNIVTIYIYKKSEGILSIDAKICDDADTNCTFLDKVNNNDEIISDVEKLEFRYGVRLKTFDTSIPPKHTPENDTFYYTDAATITAANNWTNVFAVKVFLVMRSADKNLTRNKTGWSIDGGATEYPTTDEKRLYKTFSKTIFLRAPTQ